MSEQERQEPALDGQTQEPGEAVSLGQEAVGPTVGERIRGARETAGLTAADLAQPLNLDLKVIEYIERDELDAVPGRPYILAYLRAWAGQLGLDPEALIAQYNAQRAPGNGAVQGGSYPTLDVMETRGGFGRRLLGWVVILLVIVVVIMGLSRLDTTQVRAWWNDLRGVPAEAEQPVAEPTGSDRPPIEGALDEPPAPPTDSSITSPGAAQPTAGLPEQRLAAIDNPASTEASSPAEAPASADQAPAAPVLVLKATEADSWVEVRDGKGDRLMYDVLSAGEERSFTDVEGPFSLVLGQPRGLEVEYRGEPVDLGKPNEATGVLRTTVGDS